MNITIIGTGYVGLVTGVCFADKGHSVFCIDNNEEKIATLWQGKSPIYEPGLDELLKDTIEQGTINFSSDLQKGVRHAEVIFYCLPTPQGEDGQADLRSVITVSNQIGEYFNGHKIIVNKSTVPVGTSKQVYQALSQNAADTFDVVSNPEFLREGTAIGDFMNPDRVVIGTKDDHSAQVMKLLYRDFADEDMILIVDVASSEMIKYASNSFLAAKISFINEISRLAQHHGANVELVARGIGMDARIGSRFLQAGVGYGGSCFPKDVAALAYQAESAGVDMGIVAQTIKTNTQQSEFFVSLIKDYCTKKNIDLRDQTISLFGLAFKPNTDDVREAPAVKIISQLLEAGCSVKAYDPVAMDNFRTYNSQLSVEYCHDIKETLNDTQLTVVATDWAEFKNKEFLEEIDAAHIRALFDGRNMFELDETANYNFDYTSVGRPIQLSKV